MTKKFTATSEIHKYGEGETERVYTLEFTNIEDAKKLSEILQKFEECDGRGMEILALSEVNGNKAIFANGFMSNVWESIHQDLQAAGIE